MSYDIHYTNIELIPSLLECPIYKAQRMKCVDFLGFQLPYCRLCGRELKVIGVTKPAWKRRMRLRQDISGWGRIPFPWKKVELKV